MLHDIAWSVLFFIVDDLTSTMRFFSVATNQALAEFIEGEKLPLSWCWTAIE